MSRGDWLSTTHEGICYLSLSIVVLLFAIVSCAIGSTYSFFVPIGFTLLLVSVLFFLMFLWRRKRRDGEDSRCSLCCECCTSPSADSRCDRCLAKMLCLHTPTSEEREAEIQARLTSVITPSDPSSVVVTSTRAARWPQLQSLQKVIQNLQREYQYLERYPDMISQLEECYMSLHQQEAALTEWMAGRDTPTHEDIKAMKTSLSRVKQELRRALTVAETNNLRQLPGELPSISERIDLTIVTGPQPPPYTVDDPLDSSTSSFHTELSVNDLPSVHTSNGRRNNANIGASSHNVPQIRSHNAPTGIAGRHNVPQSRHSGRHNVPDIRVSMQSSGPRDSRNSYYGYDNPSMDSSFDGQPPEDESDAPPSYEDAVSSTV